MPDLMISPTPTPPPNGAGNANALGQTGATNRSGESAKTDKESGTDIPFAAVLKAQVGKKAADPDAASSMASDSAAVKTELGNEASSVDISALLPLLGAAAPVATNVAPTSVADTEHAATEPGEKEPPVLQPVAEQSPTQVLAAVSSAPTLLPDAGLRKANVQAAQPQGETPASGAAAKTAVTAPTSGKIGLDAAITADVGNKSIEKNSPEQPASDFRALMEHASAVTPGGPSAAASSSSSQSLRIETPLGQNGWHDEMGQKLTWMVGNNRQQADLVLTPPHLGRVEVSLTMNGDQATAIFTSPNPAVREALESSLHRLREVLADAGVSLGQTHVGSESPNQPSSRNDMDFGMKEGVRYASTVPLQGVTAVARTSTGRSMIDVFA